MVKNGKLKTKDLPRKHRFLQPNPLFEDNISTNSAEPQKSLEDHLLHYCFSLE
jgi:hypothetical protein